MAKILVIDDDEQIVEGLRKTLELEGHEVAAGGNGIEALARLREQAASVGKVADLLIIDVILPDMNGLEAIQEVREEFPEVKIIAISGGARAKPDGLLRVAQRLGATHILDKPFYQADLLRSVRQLLAEEQR